MEWSKKGRKITLNISTFIKLNNYLLNTVIACKDENSQIDQEFKDRVLGVETNITNYSQNTLSNIQKINEKRKKFESNFEMSSNDFEENNLKEIQEQRNKELENLKMTSQILKDIINNQGMNPTNEQQQLFDKIDQIKIENVNVNEYNIKEANQNVKEEKNKKAKKKKKCIIF